MATKDGVIIACALTAEQNDAGWLHPMLDAAQNNLDLAGIGSQIEVLLADAGYYSDGNVTNAADDDPELLIATVAGRKLRRATEGARPDPDTTIGCSQVAQAMSERLSSPEGRELYKQRGHIIETVFGDTKHNRGHRRFCRRGRQACNAEWILICAVRNLRTWAARNRAAAAVLAGYLASARVLCASTARLFAALIVSPQPA